MSSHPNDNWKSESRKKSLLYFFLKPLSFFDGQLTLGTGVSQRGEGGVGGVRLCLPERAPGPPGLFCCDACVLSLAWLESLHLMVYSYSAVQDAVPWGSSHTQYVCEEVTERRSEPQFFMLHGRSKCFALVVRFGTTIVFKDDHRFSLILSPHADRCFIAVKQGLFFLTIILLCFTQSIFIRSFFF